MATTPYGVRLLVGAATVAVEETRRLPQTILTYPVTLMSQAAHFVMRWQQSLAELAIKGDSTLETLFPPKNEQPEWAQFDEDQDGAEPLGSSVAEPDTADPDRRVEGRFALYSDGPASDDPAPDARAARQPDRVKTAPTRKSGQGPAVPEPDAAVELDYGALTLAQLRARLRTLGVAELEELLAYEEATKARAPFQTLLANRITRATAK